MLEKPNNSRERVIRPPDQFAPDEISGWERVTAVLFGVSATLLVIRFLALLRRASACQVGRKAGDEPARSTLEAARNSRRPSSREEAAFRAGVHTAFDVIAVLRDLVDEALKSADDKGPASSRNGRRQRSNPPEVRRP